MRTDIVNSLDPAPSLTPAARTASANGGGVDLAGYDAAAVLVQAGAWTDGTHTYEVQDSDDNATFAPVADAYLDGSKPVVSSAGTASQLYKVGYRGVRRYLRIAVTVAGATTGAVGAAVVVRGKPRVKP